MASAEQLEANKRAVRQIGEIWSTGDPDDLDEIMAEDCETNFLGQTIHGREEYKERMKAQWRAFPDFTIEVQDLVAEDDVVVKHFVARGTHEGEFMGIEPTEVSTETPGFSLYHLEDGMIMESTVVADMLTVFGQMGVIEPPEA